MHDILPAESHQWQKVESAFHDVAEAYNYREIRIPALEATDLFKRSIGDDTDIVGKEMYSFTDAGGDDLTLRPEGTAGVVRAYVEHSIGSVEAVSKFYYLGPMFRRERPQKGRYRQFHQAGVEAFGAPPPLVDAEQVILLAGYFERIGLRDAVVLYNNLGSGETRTRYRARLVEYYTGHVDALCDDCKRRLESNPLRLLDCKVEGCVALRADAPAMRGSLDASDVEMMERFQALVEAAGVEAREEPRLVRGLDYYTGIVYEVEVTTDAGAVVVAGGGRYDELVGKLGGPDTKAAGFAIGLERVLGCLPEAQAAGVELFVLVPGPEAETVASGLLAEARRAGLRTDFDPRAGSVKSQMKRANKMGARFVAILGEKEVASGRVALKDMDRGDQDEISLEDVVERVSGRLGR
jgi:histidyl-tRNA synthetase